MTRMIPRRKKHIIPLTVIGIILFLVLLPYTDYFGYGLLTPYVCTGCEQGTANSNAKLVYTNFATYMTKCEVNNVIINDGIYCGSLSYSPREESYYLNYSRESALLDGSEEDALNFMRSLTGSLRQGAGYFYIMVKDGLPLQSYWSKDEKLLYYKERLTSILESGTATNTLYMDGTVAGGYPIETVDYITKPPGHTSPLPIQLILRQKAEKFVIYSSYILILFSPLIIMLAVSLFVHRFYTAKEYRNNAQTVFEAAEVYVSECKNPLPDIIYSGVLKARREEPEIYFDGSPDDISAFLSNITVDKSKNYYSIKKKTAEFRKAVSA